MCMQSTGTFSRAQTTVLLTAGEAERAMSKAKTTQTSYRPPSD